MNDNISKNLKTPRTFDEHNTLKWADNHRKYGTILIVLLASFSIITALTLLL